MKRIATLLIFGVMIFAVSAFGQNKYIGMKGCTCHKLEKNGNQVKIWEGSDHAKAYKTLLTDKANEIAKKKGLSKPAAESPECLKCHIAGYGKPQDKTYKIDEGVQCESCHGAASAYKTIHSKPENKEKAKAAGLVIGDEKTCKECHNSDSPTFKGFNFKEAMAKIAHPLKK